MKSIKGFVPGLILGIGLGLTTIGFAQSATQRDQKKNTDCCCAMASCCCTGDSCSMKDGTKEHSIKDGCCCGCCDGDSCKMKVKEKVKEKQG